MKSVIVADDHAVVRTGLQIIFQGESDFSINAEAANGADLLNQLSTQQFDVAIVDVNMPGISSIDLVAELRRLYSEMQIVIFSMNTSDDLAMRMFKNGALAYINKEENPEELLKAVRFASQNKRYLTKSQECFFANQFISGNQETIPIESLTDREYQILCLMASGKSKSEISDKLLISKNTLSNHRTNILKKLNLSNNVELTKFAIHHNLVH
ncbi:response regulator transcription factor [Plebeiibacterium sediminum]|uniref:Response regulator transcription factor n=1 Tax=Plebeiibacterium sediminum TaxID=2992112 RepID=A0AAE3SHC1_9BACT|nr:response regulator transcription factor [Plebeiobacterium sediminum]MCW3788088.1 response regulator transcription factor [Plebeiobacterium sediminum]